MPNAWPFGNAVSLGEVLNLPQLVQKAFDSGLLPDSVRVEWAVTVCQQALRTPGVVPAMSLAFDCTWAQMCVGKGRSGGLGAEGSVLGEKVGG